MTSFRLLFRGTAVLTTALMWALMSALWSAALPVAAAGAADGTFPSRPIRVIVGFPPGQGTDTIARAVAPRLQAVLGQPVFVENRPGAGGILGQQAAATAPADGYTILLTSAGPMAVNPAVYAKLPYDPIRDYVPLGGVSRVPLVMVASNRFIGGNLRELVALAKTRPGEINFASAGNGVTNHLAMEMFAHGAGIRMTHVPYRGSPAALTDLIAGRVSVMFDTPIAVLPFVRDGRLKAIAVGGTTRLQALPQVPTVAESGHAGFSAVSWLAFVAPAKTPSSVVARLEAAIAQVIAMPETQKHFGEAGVEAMPMNSAQLGAFIRSEVDKWGRAARAVGAKAE